MSELINLDKYNKVYQSDFTPQESKELLSLMAIAKAQQTLSANHRQKLLIERAHKLIGRGSLNKSCGSCVFRGLNHVIKYIEDQVLSTAYERKTRITKKKVVKKAEPKKTKVMTLNTDQKLDVDKVSSEPLFKVEEIPTNYMALKKYAETKLKKKYPKGTKKVTILKDLGA